MIAQAQVLKGIGVFTTLMGIYHWVVAEAEVSDVIFLLVITVLLVLMDAEAQNNQKQVNHSELTAQNEINQNQLIQSNSTI